MPKRKIPAFPNRATSKISRSGECSRTQTYSFWNTAPLPPILLTSANRVPLERTPLAVAKEFSYGKELLPKKESSRHSIWNRTSGTHAHCCASSCKLEQHRQNISNKPNQTKPEQNKRIVGGSAELSIDRLIHPSINKKQEAITRENAEENGEREGIPAKLNPTN